MGWLLGHSLSFKLWKHLGAKERNPFFNVLSQVYEKKCEDPRDIAYGVQSILHPSSRIQIDYGRTVEEVFDDGLVILVAEIGSEITYKWQIEKRLKLAYQLHRVMMPNSCEGYELEDGTLADYLGAPFNGIYPSLFTVNDYEANGLMAWLKTHFTWKLARFRCKNRCGSGGPLTDGSAGLGLPKDYLEKWITEFRRTSGPRESDAGLDALLDEVYENGTWESLPHGEVLLLQPQMFRFS